MKDGNLTERPPLTLQRLIQLLNQDLACEYQAIIACIVYSEVLRRASYTTVAEELERHAADEFQHAKGLAEQIAYLGGIPCTLATAVKPTPDPLALSHPEPDNQAASVGQVRYSITRGGEPSELDFSATVRAIIVQEHEHEMSMAAALGMDLLPLVARRRRKMLRSKDDLSRPQAAGSRCQRGAKRDSSRLASPQAGGLQHRKRREPKED